MYKKFFEKKTEKMISKLAIIAVISCFLGLMKSSRAFRAFSNGYTLRTKSNLVDQSFYVAKTSQKSSSLEMVDSNSLLSFEKRMDISIKLPSRDVNMVDSFLQDPLFIVQSTWDPTKCKKIDNSTYILKFLAIPIPGVDVVTPEIEVDFRYVNGSIVMKSGNWSLKGRSGETLKDSRFMRTFDIKLQGELLADASALEFNQLISVNGWVKYNVQGEKPGVLKRAPNFILDRTINFIQNNIAAFVTKKFSSRLANAFLVYANKKKASQTRPIPVEEKVEK